MKAVFLDRDGVINRYPGDKEYVKSWEEFCFLPKVKAAFKKLNINDFKIVIVSNQAGVAKGIFSQQALNAITENMLQELRQDSIEIAGVFYCTHRDEDNCACRKPKTGLIDMAIDTLKRNAPEVERRESYFIGDTIRDIETGKKSGLKTILVFSGKERPENKNNWQTLPDFTARDLSAAVEIILQ